MKRILLDEGGYVLVLRKPYAVVGTREIERDTEPASLVELPSATCSVPHCCFTCSWCEEPILLPNDRIGSPFANPNARKIDVRSIATVCHACRHVGNYSMFRACKGFDTRHKVMHAPKGGRTSLLQWLQCVEDTCAAKVPLFVRFNEDGSAEEAAGAWIWDGLTCASGHRIKEIPVDPSTELPLRTFGSQA
jgi:hypothetical protein